MGRRSAAARGGFTLLEAIVALAISGLIVLGARLLMDAVANEADHVTRVARAADASANETRLLTHLIGQLEVGTPDAHPFDGADQAVRFTTWCATPGGWEERCDALLAFEHRSDTNTLVAHLTPLSFGADIGPETVILARGFRAGAFRYLNDARAGGEWFVRWDGGLVAPLAIGLVLQHDSTMDTTIVRIGERG